jgi:riboflavin kinase/FMN adenylyltransferase
MDVIHFPEDPRPSRWVYPVLALGNFDGLHRGHRKILDRMRRVADERGSTSVIMTFDPHPPRVVRPDKAPPLLMTKAQKLEAIAAAGVQGAAVVRFTPELSNWEPETFVRTVLVDWLRVAEVWVGANFSSATIDPATSRCCASRRRYGFKAEKIDPVRYKDFVVSSTRVRRLVSEGASTKRARCSATVLHRRHVVRGDQRGRTIGFPTANLCTDNELLPPHGVYATHRAIGDRASVGDQYRHPADRRRIGPHRRRDAHLRLRSRSVRPAFASASSSGCATSARSIAGRAPRADRGRLPRARVPVRSVLSL